MVGLPLILNSNQHFKVTLLHDAEIQPLNISAAVRLREIITVEH